MGQTYEIDQERLYKLFKRILDDKFSDLKMVKSPNWENEQDSVTWIDSSGKPLVRYERFSFDVARNYYWSFMNLMPISYRITNELFTKYFREKFPKKDFIAVLDEDL